MLLISIFGCGSFSSMPVETQAVISYTSMGEVLNTAKPILQNLCNNGTLSIEDCEAAQIAYNEAVKVYHELAEVGKAVVDSGDDLEYRTMAQQLLDLLAVIQTYTGGQ
jgi:hypothetical protein